MTLNPVAPDYLSMASLTANCTAHRLLPFQGLNIQIWADNPQTLTLLDQYYSGLTASTVRHDQPLLSVFLIDQAVNTQGMEWTPVTRHKPGPNGLKEAYRDAPEGRWIHKVRTGMVFLQTLDAPLAMGDLNRHFSQVVNFINNQFLNVQQRRGYLLGHAAAFTVDGQATAIAASSGGGKSTLMLKALEKTGVRFLSNDRILFRSQPEATVTEVLGVAKHPRVNPGTLVSSPRLASLLSPAESERYRRMPAAQLWDVEHKHDVLIPALYGEGKAALSSKLGTLVLLDWSLSSAMPTGLSRVEIEQTPEALEGLRKSSGPFFQSDDGHFPPEQAPSCDVYARQLAGVKVLRLTGGVDFDRAIELLEAEGLLA